MLNGFRRNLFLRQMATVQYLSCLLEFRRRQLLKPSTILAIGLFLSLPLPIKQNMQSKTVLKQKRRCAYIKSCYLAAEIKCFGYKTDCPLYQKSNGEYYNEDRFNAAVDRLIDKTRAKHINLAK